MVTFQLDTNNPSFNVLTFSFDGALDPAVLADIEADLNTLLDWIDFSKGFIISGRGPVWLYGAIIHHLHPARWVATHDPRLGGGVVVQTHVADTAMGQVIPM